MPSAFGLYDPAFEHDACGVGFVANIDGRKSHAIITRGIDVLKNLLHRGAVGADKDTGDGAGILFQVPDAFLRRAVKPLQITLPPLHAYGLGMVFLPRGAAERKRCMQIIEDAGVAEGLSLLGWREVPVDPSALGEKARQEMPAIFQCFLAGQGLAGDALERRLYRTRKRAQADKAMPADGSCYVCSMSCRTVVYKGLMMAPQVAAFYADLREEDLDSAVAVVHQRYSTNTFPSWNLAQPFRLLAHNGEINTLRGNLNWMRAREGNLKPRHLGDIAPLLPVIEKGGSDSACLDNALDLLVRDGRSVQHAMLMLIPQAWGQKYPMGPDLRGFFEYHAGLTEPWDGPAAVAFFDGLRVGAMLDRNGLRPARYCVTKDGFVVFASEAGVLDLPAAEVQERGSLRPGQMILVDLELGRIMRDGEVKSRLARAQPYRRWVEENRIDVHGFFDAVSPIAPDQDALLFRERLFGYTREDRKEIIGPMAAKGAEPVGSMGADQPLAVLSEKPQLLYWYFKQIFAQVTNPPIDPIREELVMSQMTFLGIADNVLAETPQQARLVKLRQPVLSNEDLDRIRHLKPKDFQSATISIGFTPGGGRELEAALERVFAEADAAVAAGRRFLVLSDKHLPAGEAPIPALLAVAGLNNHLSRRGQRTSAAILVETGEAREVMHLALLLGYGASAVNPWLAFEVVADMALKGELEPAVGVAKALENFIKSLCKGLLKVMSKIGISTLRSYRNAQVFEAVGLDDALVARYFEGTASRVGGIGIDGVAREAAERHREALAGAGSPVLPSGGQYSYRTDGERHLWTPQTISLLQRATRTGDRALYRQYADLINGQAERQSTLRGLFRFKAQTPVPLEEVEPVSAIVKRFVTGAMSFGSISREAHETLAAAMNSLGAMSNSGEGGEDPARYKLKPDGTNLCSAVKQVASGRFGVTTEYLISAREMQIKIAQGAKPGEGGQLPGHKVNAEIASVRNSTPGVTLISPPPHHDIYSIEDIAQLIYDLKRVNPEARVSVKLVSEAGVGTIAAGVAKGRSDMILISGYDGGTGASPLSSIKHAGAPWELGLSETQQTLVLNRLRGRVRLQCDGQMKTGRDVAVAALLGAEEFGFATAPLVVCGCIMMRKCHTNMCPVGVATQDPDLRRRYTGKPEYLVNFFTMIAEELRGIMAGLGLRRLDDMVGRVDLLETAGAVEFWKAKGLDFSRILAKAPNASETDLRRVAPQEHDLEGGFDYRIWPQVRQAVEEGGKLELALPVKNTDRTVGATISGRLVKRHGAKGLPADSLILRLRGAAGQSFGAFCCPGITLVLEGQANDYLGKSLSGGRIVVRPESGAAFSAEHNVIAGNVLLYGATSGEVYINGRAGERFAVRNSGANAVVEGVGDHGCEYMTGGRVAILGPTGVNFGAGMSGGIAYVYDEDGLFDSRCNLEMLDLEAVASREDQAELRGLLTRHHQHTGSKRAERMLAHWEEILPRFVKVFPTEYKKVLGRMSREDQQTEREEVARL